MGGLGHRTPRERDPAYMGWVAKLPCIGCLARYGRVKRGVQVAHIRSGYPEIGESWRPAGMQEKPHDWRTAPLCVDCHLSGPSAQHRRNEADWWSDLGIYPPDLCDYLFEAYRRGRPGYPVLVRFAAAGRRQEIA